MSETTTMEAMPGFRRGRGDLAPMLADGQDFEAYCRRQAELARQRALSEPPAPPKRLYDPNVLVRYPLKREPLGLVGSLARMTFDTFEPVTDSQQTALRLARRWVERFDPCLPDCGVPGLCFGSPEHRVGVGKSHLACAIANYLIDHGYSSLRFTTLFDILTDIKRSFGSKQEGAEEAVLHAYLSPKVIILDDVGKEPVHSTWEAGQIFSLIDKWIQRGTRIIATTNMSEQGLIERYGGPGASRLIGLCGSRVIAIDGQDRRKTDGAHNDFFDLG